MNTIHRMQSTASPNGLLFECVDGCGRRLIVDGVSGALTIIDRGDPSVLHHASGYGVELAPPRLEPGSATGS
jgi:hypothetical protein